MGEPWQPGQTVMHLAGPDGESQATIYKDRSVAYGQHRVHLGCGP